MSKQTISVVLDENDAQVIKEHCNNIGMNMSAQIRVWVKEKLNTLNVDLNKHRGGE